MLKPKRVLWSVAAEVDNQISKSTSRQAAGTERGKKLTDSFVLNSD